MANQTKDIKYINKNFDSFKGDLIEYAKAYFPQNYTDFSQPSPGSMFIEMASYIGDVLSFYLDNQIQETFIQYAKQSNNLYTLAYMLGYRPKVISTALVNLDVYQQIPFTRHGQQNIVPDWTYALNIQPGMQVKSNVNSNVYFYVPERVDFTVSSSLNPTEVSVYTLNGNNPETYLLKKTVQAISGQIKTVSFTFGAAERFNTVTINDSNIVSIVSAVDTAGNNWYEVPYLAQDFILSGSENSGADKNTVPYMMQKVNVPRRFTSRFQSNESLVIEFGSGINSNTDDTAYIPNPNSVSVGLTGGGLSQLGTAYDPTNFVTTQTYGLAPANTTITFTYLVANGAQDNVLANQLTVPVDFIATGIDTSYQTTIVTNNPEAASGGGDGDTSLDLRMNSMAEFQTQYRAVTQQDYLARTLSMPGQFGKVSKAFVTQDDITFANYNSSDPAERDPILMSLYVLGLDFNGNLAIPTTNLIANINTYLQNYRMLTDSIKIKPAYIINIGVNYDIVLRPNYNGQDVLSRTLTAVQNFFDIDNWQINQPIVLSNLYTVIDSVEGVQTVKNIEVVNLSGEANGYSKYNYDIKGATNNNVIYPSLDPSIFEVKYPNIDIKGRVTSL
jgi:phage-related baseplate assembly protein